MEILEIIKLIAMVLLGALTIVFKTKEGLAKKVDEVIADAEETFKDTVKSGTEKKTYAVDVLYGMIPTPINLIVTRDVIEDLVQKTFDEITRFTKNQVDKAVDKIEEVLDDTTK